MYKHRQTRAISHFAQLLSLSLVIAMATSLQADQKRGSGAHEHSAVSGDGKPAGKAVAYLGASGYDLVSYMDTNEAKPGTAAYGMTYDGVSYLFSSLKNLNKFKSEPKKYLPAFGGYCVKSLVSGGRAKHGSPKCYKVIKGRTHLFSSEDAMKAFEASEKEDQMMQLEQARTSYKKLKMRIGGRRN